MRFDISIAGGKAYSVNLQRENKDGSVLYRVEIPDLHFKKEYALLKRVEDGLLLISDSERVFQVKPVERKPRSASFLVNDRSVFAEIMTRESSVKPSSGTSSIADVGESVISNFPARVVKIQATKGAQLGEGDTLLVVEAMKMEAQIKTPHPCEVLEVLVKEGDRIEKGRVLARLKF